MRLPRAGMFEKLVHLSHRLLMHPWQYVRVNAERHFDIAVAQDFLNHLGADVHFEQETGGSVAQVVKTNHRQLRLFQQRMKVSTEMTRIEEVSIGVTEHQTMIFPGGAHLQAFFKLACSMFFQHLHHEYRQGDLAPALFGFWL